MKFLCSIIGFFIGAALDDWPGAIFGCVAGLLTGTLIQHKNRIQKIEQQLKLIPSDHIDNPVDTVPKSAGINDIPSEQAFVQARRESATKLGSPSAGDHPLLGDHKTGLIKQGIGRLKEYFTTGNMVAKAGAIILFFGIGLLLKYINDRGVIPIEFYLFAVAAVGVAMQLIGWKLHAKRPDFALILQGGAIGILYITVFTATKIQVLPLGVAFIVMLALVVSTGFIAVVQDSRALACLGIIGGFLAPILTSDDTGNHVALFSYYAALNAGILGIAWHKSWRILNWIGFIFTFVIASLWGHTAYTPQYFNTVEPFLILFFIFYVAVPILFAHRQPLHLKGLVDGSMVFGVPLFGFVLQSALVNDFEYGRAFSALGFAITYLVLARLLWHKQVENMRMMAESFLALGIIFASLAVPYTLNGHWTAVTWALEGAGITWVGIRQHRLLARVFGILLQFGGAMIFLTVASHPYGSMPLINSVYIGSLFVCMGGLFIAYQYYRHSQSLPIAEQEFYIVPMIWGLVWWFGAGVMEIDHHVPPEYALNATLFFIATSLLLVSLSARTLEWQGFEHPPILLLPTMTVIALFLYLDNPNLNPFLNLGYIAWITAFAIQYVLLYRCDTIWHKGVTSCWHAITMWLYTFIATWIIADATNDLMAGYNIWGNVMWGLIPALVISKLLLFRERCTWPLQQYKNEYLGSGLLPMVVFLAIWIVIMCFNQIDSAPLKYWPILNPQDIVQLFAIMVIVDWLHRIKGNRVPMPIGLNVNAGFTIIAIILFIWLNALAAHSVNHYAGVSYDMASMFGSTIFQTSISIIWTLTAFLIMGTATRLGKLYLWAIGSILLAIVFTKLFLIDLANSGTVARIISFLTVGVLMLVIAYLSPPPAKVQSTGNDTPGPS